MPVMPTILLDASVPASDGIALAGIGLASACVALLGKIMATQAKERDKDRTERERDRVIRELEAKASIDTAAATKLLVDTLKQARLMLADERNTERGTGRRAQRGNDGSSA